MVLDRQLSRQVPPYERPFRLPEQIRLLPNARNRVIQALSALAFTVAPHLQIINYHGRFSRFVGI